MILQAWVFHQYLFPVLCPASSSSATTVLPWANYKISISLPPTLLWFMLFSLLFNGNLFFCIFCFLYYEVHYKKDWKEDFLLLCHCQTSNTETETDTENIMYSHPLSYFIVQVGGLTVLLFYFFYAYTLSFWLESIFQGILLLPFLYPDSCQVYTEKIQIMAVQQWVKLKEKLKFE